jgi:alpha-galactosidase
LNDPDCLMVRDSRTHLSEDEVRSLATAIALTDGMLVLSDRVEQLSASRLDLLDRTRKLSGGQFRIVDLMRADIPELIVSHSPERTVVAVFNFADTSQSRSIDLNELGIVTGRGQVREWWTGAELSVQTGRVHFANVPAHGCRVVVF